MTAKPIIFSAPMIRALLDGRKSMTRRILKPQPPEWVTRMCHEGRNGWIGSGDGHGTLMHVPYAPGDRLWCREGFSYGWPVEENHQLPECNQEHAITYRTDGNRPFGGGKWHSPIHMPRWASRLTLIVTDVRVQRLQEISEDDARAEGVTPHGGGWTGYGRDADLWLSNAKDGFRSLWNSIHGPGAWDASPWVCAITFDVQRGNIDDTEVGG